MKKIIVVIMLALVLPLEALACTNFIVGKQASADGSTGAAGSGASADTDVSARTAGSFPATDGRANAAGRNAGHSSSGGSGAGFA